MGIADEYKGRYSCAGKPQWDIWKGDFKSRYSHRGRIFHSSIGEQSPVSLFEILQSMPEPSYQEVATTSFIADYLLGLEYTLDRGRPQMSSSLAGISYHYDQCRPQIYETEIIAYTGKPSVFIRVDLDAVSMGKGASQHSCGHAVNMASVLTLAKKAKEENIPLGLIFQPAEEGPGNPYIDGYEHASGFGGGQYLRAKGIYQEIPSIISCHIDTSLHDDEVRITAGQATAAGYRFRIQIAGKPAHAALPWQGVNPVNGLVGVLNEIEQTNQRFKEEEKAWFIPQYGLLTPSQVHTEECELNSLAHSATIRGISRISGAVALKMFQDFMRKYNASIELESPPVFNDERLARIAKEVATENKYTIREDPARFRDETAWAGPLFEPWVENPKFYKKGCDRILHFFTPNYNKESGGLHSTSFKPDPQRAIDTQVNMLLGIVKKF